jgi:hypothetical protein
MRTIMQVRSVEELSERFAKPAEAQHVHAAWATHSSQGRQAWTP